MSSLEKQEIVSAEGPNRLGIKGNRKKEALQKIARYLRDERGYSESEIKRFMTESFMGNDDDQENVAIRTSGT